MDSGDYPKPILICFKINLTIYVLSKSSRLVQFYSVHLTSVRNVVCDTLFINSYRSFEHFKITESVDLNMGKNDFTILIIKNN